MAQASVGQASGHNYTTSATTLKYRTKNSGNPLNHDDVDANFDILRKAINGVINDVDGVVDKNLTSDLSNATLGYTVDATNRNYPVAKSNNKLYVNVPWANTTYSAGSGLSLSGTAFSHSDTSNQASVNNSGRTVIQDITLDAYGHVTALASATLSDTNTTYGVAGTSLGLVKEGGDIDIDASGNMTIKDGAVDVSAIASTINLTGGAGTGFNQAAVMCPPVVINGVNDTWVFVSNYGSGTAGQHLAQYKLDGTLVSHILPRGSAGSNGTTSWPFKHTALWATPWPHMWTDGAYVGGTARIYIKYAASYFSHIDVNLSTGAATIADKGVDGVHAGGGNAFGDGWNIACRRSNGDMMMAFAYPNTGVNQVDNATVYNMTKGALNTPYGSSAYSYIGNIRYFPITSDYLTSPGPATLEASQKYTHYMMICGINPATGRVYVYVRGGDDHMQVWQLTTPSGSGAYKYYDAFANILKGGVQQSRSGLNYVKSFAIPDHSYDNGGDQTQNYQVQFSTRNSESESCTPLYITRGGYSGPWAHGGGQLIPWKSEWT
jgi:hypothetical protein